MKYLLDTNICIYIIKQKPEKVFRKFRSYHVGQIGISSVSYSELFYGASKSQRAVQNETALEQFTAPLEILPFTEETAATYGKIRANLEKQGKSIGPLDMLIASHAVHLGLTLVTNNIKEFSKVPKLKIENWA